MHAPHTSSQHCQMATACASSTRGTGGLALSSLLTGAAWVSVLLLPCSPETLMGLTRYGFLGKGCPATQTGDTQGHRPP